MKGYQFKLLKVGDDFAWHNHKDTDETFIVLEGQLRIDFRDGFIELGEGEMYVIPKGTEHKPFSDSATKILVIEPECH